MNRRSAGVCFLAIAAFLYAARHLVAAIYGTGGQTWSNEIYQRILNYVGTDLWVLGAVAAAVGIGYLVWAEVGDRRGPVDP